MCIIRDGRLPYFGHIECVWAVCRMLMMGHCFIAPVITSSPKETPWGGTDLLHLDGSPRTPSWEWAAGNLAVALDLLRFYHDPPTANCAALESPKNQQQAYVDH